MKSTVYQLLLLVFFLAPAMAEAQQLSAYSGWPGQEFIYNPAMTSLNRRSTVNAQYQQLWSGFNDAPSTIQLSGQLPVNKHPMTLGAFLEADQILPIRQNTFGVTYAYHLGGYGRNSNGNRLFIKRSRSQLSIGFSATMQQVSLDRAQLVINDVNDQSLPMGDAKLSSPNFNVGVYYSGTPGGVSGLSYGFIGLAFRQILSDRLPIREDSEASGLLDRAMHSNITLGYHYEDEGLVLRPMLWVDVAADAPSETRLSLQAEIQQKITAGLSYNLSQTLGIQLGYIIPQGESDGKRIRIGAQGVFNLGSATAVRGLGYSFFMAYDFGSRADRLN